MNIYKYFEKPEDLDGYTIAFVTVPELAYYYAVEMNKRFPEGEKAIASDPYYAYFYALNIIKGRFPEGEKAIASDSKYAYWYARDIIKGSFPEGEKVINSDPKYKEKYEKFLKTI